MLDRSSRLRLCWFKDGSAWVVGPVVADLPGWCVDDLLGWLALGGGWWGKGTRALLDGLAGVPGVAAGLGFLKCFFLGGWDIDEGKVARSRIGTKP